MAPTKKTSCANDPRKKDGKPSMKTLESKRKRSFSRYVRRLLKEMKPKFTLQAEAVAVLNELVNDTYERVAAEASRLSLYHGKPEITPREIEAAIKVLFPGDVSKHMNLNRPMAALENQDE
ncbi:late histone H2B.L4-like [Galendromus occidentalis]|uniref:Late histone H2B.L4-like n=1 Tax=Galendromus occidentalis TaxID=34638 RepID=A0AAJ6QWL6_9ACAR|nr:late histone H2B.L4-like [Galendromus occidentalis]